MNIDHVPEQTRHIMLPLKDITRRLAVRRLNANGILRLKESMQRSGFLDKFPLIVALLFLFPFPSLQHSFWQTSLPHLPRPDSGLSVMPDENRTEGRVVGRSAMVNALPTRCFLITFDGEYHEMKPDFDMRLLRERFLHKKPKPEGGIEGSYPLFRCPSQSASASGKKETNRSKRESLHQYSPQEKRTARVLRGDVNGSVHAGERFTSPRTAFLSFSLTCLSCARAGWEEDSSWFAHGLIHTDTERKRFIMAIQPQATPPPTPSRRPRTARLGNWNMGIAKMHRIATQFVGMQLSGANLLALTVSAASVVAGTVSLVAERYPYNWPCSTIAEPSVSYIRSIGAKASTPPACTANNVASPSLLRRWEPSPVLRLVGCSII